MIPEGWKIERIDGKPFRSVIVTAPTGEAAVVHSHDRNPSNVLYKLATALLEDSRVKITQQGWMQLPGEGDWMCVVEGRCGDAMKVVRNVVPAWVYSNLLRREMHEAECREALLQAFA